MPTRINQIKEKCKPLEERPLRRSVDFVALSEDVADLIEQSSSIIKELIEEVEELMKNQVWTVGVSRKVSEAHKELKDRFDALQEEREGESK